MRAAAILISKKFISLRFTTARRLSAYMLSRALATNIASSCTLCCKQCLARVYTRIFRDIKLIVITVLSNSSVVWSPEFQQLSTCAAATSRARRCNPGHGNDSDHAECPLSSWPVIPVTSHVHRSIARTTQRDSVALMSLAPRISHPL